MQTACAVGDTWFWLPRLRAGERHATRERGSYGVQRDSVVRKHVMGRKIKWETRRHSQQQRLAQGKEVPLILHLEDKFTEQKQCRFVARHPHRHPSSRYKSWSSYTDAQHRLIHWIGKPDRVHELIQYYTQRLLCAHVR
jgi:prolyl-tRNA synthetase